ncbi:MAG: hypothetical protein UHL07_01440, partial [Bacteroidaceae bacterium]|nr:hypothetical protein [Bacteroidaceae bacterium]
MSDNFPTALTSPKTGGGSAISKQKLNIRLVLRSPFTIFVKHKTLLTIDFFMETLINLLSLVGSLGLFLYG